MTTLRPRKTRGSRLGKATAAVLAVVVCQACASEEQPQSEPEVLTILGTVEPTSFDSGEGGDYQNYALNMLMYQNLAEQDSEGNIHNVLADSIEVGSDNITYTITLKEGIEFSDGTPFNSEAVCYTIDQLIDPDSTKAHASTWSAVDLCEEVDDSTVVLTTAGPYAPLMQEVIAGGYAGQILSPSMAEFGEDAGSHPIGTGPYMLKEWVRGDHVELVRNPNYSADVLGDAPHYERIVWRVVPEDTTRVLLLKQGEADFAYDVPSAQVADLTAAGGVEIMNAPGLWQWFLLNDQQPPFNDERVRQAANYAVDKESIIDAALAGQATVAEGVVGSGFTGHSAVGSYEYDPDKARELLTEANAVGATVVIDTPSGRYPGDRTAAQAVADQLNAVGFQATVELTGDWPAYQEKIASDGLQMAFLGWQPTDVGRFLQRTVTCEGGAWNLGPFCDPEIDSMVAAANGELDAAANAPRLEELQGALFDQAQGLYMYSVNLIAGASDDLTGVVIQPNTLINLRGAHPA